MSCMLSVKKMIHIQNILTRVVKIMMMKMIAGSMKDLKTLKLAISTTMMIVLTGILTYFFIYFSYTLVIIIIELYVWKE